MAERDTGPHTTMVPPFVPSFENAVARLPTGEAADSPLPLPPSLTYTAFSAACTDGIRENVKSTQIIKESILVAFFINASVYIHR